MVVLEPAEFARLDAYRRRVGARTASLAWLRQPLAAGNTRLAVVDAQLTEANRRAAARSWRIR